MAAKVKGLRGKAPLTLVRTNDARMVYVYAGRPAPDNITAADRERLVPDYLEEYELPAAVAKALEADGSGSDGSGSGSEDGPFDESTLGTASIKPTLAWVGEDKARAEQALAAEQSKPVKDQRSSLVEALEKITDPQA